MANWRELINERMYEIGDEWTCTTTCTLDDDGLDREFDDGFGNVNGAPFTLWTDSYVYFPACSDGSEWCASVPRHPGDPHGTPTGHQGSRGVRRK